MLYEELNHARVTTLKGHHEGRPTNDIPAVGLCSVAEKKGHDLLVSLVRRLVQRRR